jgi:hypothetical protein
MIDYIILSSYSAFAVIMQLHGGWVGFLQTKCLDSLGCLWFNRTEVGALVFVGEWGLVTGQVTSRCVAAAMLREAAA